MKMIIRGRGNGKTSELIRLAAETGTYIVCTDHRRAWQIAQQAEGMGLSIPFPLTAEEWQRRSYGPPGVQGMAFDDLDRIIQGMTGVPVLAATWTADDEPEEQPRTDSKADDPLGELRYELGARIREVDRIRKDYRALTGEVIAALSTDEHQMAVVAGLPVCACGLSLGGGDASGSFITHVLGLAKPGVPGDVRRHGGAPRL